MIEHQGFYEVGAQVIPVLFFVLLFQLGWFGQSDNRASPRFAVFDLGIVVLAAVGELVCVSALAEDRQPSGAEKTVVIVAIAMLFLPAIVRASRPRFAAIAEAWPRSRKVGRILAVLLPFVVLALAVAHVRLLPVLAVSALVFAFVAIAGQGIADDWESGRLDFLKRRRDKAD